MTIEYDILRDITEDYSRIQVGIKFLQEVYLKDMSVDINARWAAFEHISKLNLLPIETYGDGLISELEGASTLYDDFYVERHETKKYVDMFESIQEDEIEVGVPKYSTEAVDKWREAVLASGDMGFTYDW